MPEESNGSGQAPDYAVRLEVIVKWLAALVAISAFMGVNYNDAFFFGAKEEWLFFLSIEDNVLASIYAMPTAFFVVVLFSYGATAFRVGDSSESWMSRFKLFWLLTTFVVASIVLMPVEERPLPQDMHEWTVAIVGLVVVLGLIPVVLFGILVVFSAIFDEPHHRLFAVGAAGIFLVMFASAVTARIDRELSEVRPDLVCQLMDRSWVRGKLVRALTTGFILARGEDWIWLPRSDVKIMMERTN